MEKVLKALLAKIDGTNSLARDEDQKTFWVGLLTRGRWVVKDAGSKENWQACGRRFGDRQMLPECNTFLRPAVLSVLTKLTWPVLTRLTSTIQAVKCVILYLLMEDRPQPNTVYIRLPTFVTIPNVMPTPFLTPKLCGGGRGGIMLL